jgi:hypothetical protein
MPLVKEHLDARQLRAYPILMAARPFAARTGPGRFVQRFTRGRLRRFLLWQIYYAFSRGYRRKFRGANPELVRMVLELQAGRPISPSDRRHVLRWFLHHTGAYMFLKSRLRPKEALIFDEGFVHRVVQIFASENEALERDRVAAYLDLIPEPDLVVYTHASREVCEQRVLERGLWERFARKPPAATSRFIRSAHQVVEFSVRHIRDKGWAVIEVDNDTQLLRVTDRALAGALPEELINLAEGLI